MDSIIKPYFRRTNLLVGLLLIVLIAVGPAFAVLLNLQSELRQTRVLQASAMAQQRAELMEASVSGLIQSARETMMALSVAQRVREMSPSCGGLLADMRRSENSYALLTVVRRDGSPVCSSAAVPLPPAAQLSLVQPFLSAAGFTTGLYTNPPELGSPLLSLALPFTGDDGAPALLIAGLDLRRFDALLASLRQQPDGRLVIADREGIVLARAPEQFTAPGDNLGEIRRLFDAVQGQVGQSGAELFDSPDGSKRVVGYVSPGKDATRLFVAAGFDVADLVTGIDAATRRGYVLILLGASLSVLLALVLGNQYLRAPMAVLLEAARRLGRGDLSARVSMPTGATSEFVGLGGAVNEMAATLDQQRAELRALNNALELRVADRTRALLDSNNRLQVEIAERELTEASLRQAQKLQAVGQLAGGMAHEFNNLLTAILGSLELLRKRIGADSRQTRLLDTATSAVERGSRLTSQLLAFSHKQPQLSISMDMAESIRGMVSLLGTTLGSKARLQTRIDDELWPAMLDPNQFEAALLNLALNARDAMLSGGRLMITASNVTLTPASAWTDVPPGDYVEVTVSDTGIGMSADVHSRAFEPFFTTKPPGQGAGLGLSQVHGMVRQSGGSVTIKSHPGDGTRIAMMFPRSLVSAVTKDAGFDATVPALGRDRAVLLVDDDVQVRAVTEAVLMDAGYTVLTAPDGQGGLDLMAAEGRRVSLVISDYAMPGMSGREMLQAVKQGWPDTAILLATGYADFLDLTGNDLPIDQIVRKPFRSNDLLARIHMVIQRQGQRSPTANAQAG